MYTVQTPRGRTARFHCRENSNDRMTVEGDVTQDRYGLASLPREGGIHIDIGAHIGTWLIAVLLDDPEATAIAVEPLAANVEAIERNAEENGVIDRVTIHHAAFAKRGPVDITWNYRSVLDVEQARMHRYIGGFDLDILPPDTSYDTEKVPAITPAKLLKGLGDVAVLKVAGETSEQALIGANLKRVSLILGKYHSELPGLVPHLAKTHTVMVHDDPKEPQLFQRYGWYRAEAAASGKPSA